MKSEERVIKASLMAGLSDVIVGILFHFTGIHDWYFTNFKFFGVLGIGMLLYAFWHAYFYYSDTRWSLWKNE